MSKEVKRYTMWQDGSCSGPQDEGDWVTSEDYDALLAEREAMKRVLRDARDVIATALKAGAPDWFETEEDIATHTTIKKIDAALQGAQPCSQR